MSKVLDDMLEEEEVGVFNMFELGVNAFELFANFSLNNLIIKFFALILKLIFSTKFLINDNRILIEFLNNVNRIYFIIY